MSDPNDYTVGWICALPAESAAAQAFLDEKHEGPTTQDAQDTNNYRFGKIKAHNVVIAVLPMGEYGTASAAGVAINMLRSFRNVRIGLMVGIGGGAPSSTNDIRLGDVVVSVPKDGQSGVFQYDFGKSIQEKSFHLTRTLDQPPHALLAAVSAVQVGHDMDEIAGNGLEKAVNEAMEGKPRFRRKYGRPLESTDVLFRSDFVHVRDEDSCKACGIDHVVDRKARTEEDDNPQIHYGTIASANTLMKDALIRDELASEKNVLCFEMEAAGLMNRFRCLVIRGICDYSDSHKNKKWQGFAAMTAAAYAKQIISRIRPETISREKTLSEQLDEVLSEVTETKQDVQSIKRVQEDSQVLKWLLDIDSGAQQTDTLSKRQPGTCQWFLDSNEYQLWVREKGQILFCPGIPGAGKTILTSIVIQDLTERFHDVPNVGIAHIYCNFRRQSSQGLRRLLSNILGQLCQHQPTVPECVKSHYRAHGKGRTGLQPQEIWDDLKFLIGCYSKTFIAVDALDEWEATNDEYSNLVDELLRLHTTFNINLFVTSRLVPEIEKRFRQYPSLKISAHQKDIHDYIQGHSWRIPSFVAKSPELHQRIKTSIAEAVQGINLALRVLSWISCASRELTIYELQHALALGDDDTELHEDSIPEVDLLISVCCGLVTVDEAGRIIRLVHYTTQNYFQKSQHRHFPGAQAYIAKQCINYLSLPGFENKPDGWYNESGGDLYPFYRYAAVDWANHARKAMAPTNQVDELALRLLRSDPKVNATLQILFSSTDKYYKYKDGQTVLVTIKGLHLAAMLGLGHLIPSLTEPLGINSKDTLGQTALHWAADAGHTDTVQLLLENGSEVEPKCFKELTPLFKAIKNSHLAVVRALLNAGADVNALQPYGNTAINLAAECGHSEIVELLLDKGANASISNMYGETPLITAVHEGHRSTYDSLFNQGAQIDSHGENGRTALIESARVGDEPLVRTLLKQSARVNTQDRFGRTSLMEASKEGHQGIVELLLQQGADLNIQNRYGCTALMRASEIGHQGIVELLLQQGADLNIQDRYGCTALMRASEIGHQGTVELLVEEGAIVDIQDHSGRTALMRAIERGHRDILKSLLKIGADPALQDHKGGTSLIKASEHGHLDIVSLLLERSVHPTSGETGAALSQACHNGHVEIVKLLLEKGVDPRFPTGAYDAPLVAAIRGGHQGIFELLLEVDADFRHREGELDTCIHQASKGGNETFVQWLIQKGADIHSMNKQGYTPIMLASRNNHESIVQLLRDAGATFVSHLNKKTTNRRRSNSPSSS
ncbi:hypothetical protein FDECE_752 [Fusarium decemcellulare]|nr:hypothetical protein FDECE_752 [Fusarium decemcellulare]